MILKKLFFLWIVLFFFFDLAYCQVYLNSEELKEDDVPDSLTFQIIRIETIGNVKTKQYILLRELFFNAGDVVQIKDFFLAQKRILSLFLFNRVIFDLVGNEEALILIITVSERWYIFPLPVIYLNERSWEKISYGVKNSEKLAKELLNCLKKTRLNIHYCTTTTKDKAQLARRIKRRALSVALKTDFITKEGTLVRGAIYLPELKPGFGYGLQVESINTKRFEAKLKKAKTKLQKQLKIPANIMHIDLLRPRILTSLAVVDELKADIKQLKLVPAIIEEYPTWDALEVDVRFL